MRHSAVDAGRRAMCGPRKDTSHTLQDQCRKMPHKESDTADRATHKPDTRRHTAIAGAFVLSQDERR
jgi:hypothetical protein